MSRSVYDDSQLFAGVAAGDRTMFRELHKRHARAVYVNCLSLVGSSSDAEEVVQEVWLEFWRRKSQIVLADRSLLPWLLVTSRYRSLDWLRKRKTNSVSLSAEEWNRLGDGGGPDGFSAREAATAVSEVIADAVATLPPDGRRIYELCLRDGLSYSQAASELGITHASLRNRLSRVRAVLRSAINPHDD